MKSEEELCSQISRPSSVFRYEDERNVKKQLNSKREERYTNSKRIKIKIKIKIRKVYPKITLIY